MPLRIIHGVDADSGPRLARALRRLVACDDSLNVSTAEGLRSLARALDAAEVTAVGSWAGCTVTLDPGQSEVDTSAVALTDVVDDAVRRARLSAGADSRVVELNVSVVAAAEARHA